LRTNNMEQAHGLNNMVAGDIELAKKVVAVFKDAKNSLELMLDEQATDYDEPLPDSKDSKPCAEGVSSQDSTDSTLGSCNDEFIPCQEDESETELYGNGVYNQDCTLEPSQPSLAPICEQNRQIISGIIETLDIKADSLHESLGLFLEDSESLLATFASDMPKLSEENLTEAASQLQDAWLENPPAQDAWASSLQSKRPAPETLANFFAECISLGAFAAYSDKFAKHITNIRTKIEKASFRFKKETLLYEISTYEEILYHSVSRLRQSPAASDFVSILDETFFELEAMITEYGITIIRPAPHDAFNGREHEVLMAEVQEGFAKGEIIKVMTSGYRHNDQVILRANVIAAR